MAGHPGSWESDVDLRVDKVIKPPKGDIMSQPAWILRAAFAATATSLAVSGCSSDSATPAPEVTVTQTEAAPAATAAATPTTPATPAATEASTSLPAPPAGATQVDSADKGGMQYARYKISGSSAEDVVSGYESEFKAQGYEITNAGGSGGGWGKWGGDGYGMDASMDGSYASVQAGGSSSGPTFFEVCVGPDKSVVDQCGQESQNDENDSNSKGS